MSGLTERHQRWEWIHHCLAPIAARWSESIGEGTGGFLSKEASNGGALNAAGTEERGLKEASSRS